MRNDIIKARSTASKKDKEKYSEELNKIDAKIKDLKNKKKIIDKAMKNNK